MNTRLEIFVNGVWQTLELWDRASIKYNKIVNKIASIDTREISSSNTLSIPPNYYNRQVLGINVFNQQQLAKALNSRYEAKYYIEEKLVQEGFIVISRSTEEAIRIIFIDRSLEIVDEWGSTKFRDLINSPQLDIPADYRLAIQEMKNYSLPTNAVANLLSEVGSRGHNLCLFPNNLNAIGGGYMVDKEDVRPDNSFNPYQSRPIFNAKSVFDLASTAYGFTPIYDESVNWKEVEKTYIVPSGLNDNFVDEGVTTIFSTIVYDGSSLLIDSTNDRIAIISAAYRSFKPNGITGWSDPEAGWGTSHLDQNIIFRPDLDIQSNGIIRYRVEFTNGATTTANNAYGVWMNDTNTGVIFKSLFIDNENLLNGGTLQYEINKVQLFDSPPNSGDFLGVVSTVETSAAIFNYQITESFLAIESVSYDERGQFESQSIDLTYAAPSNTVKELLVSLMSQFGILMNIDNKTNEILFFNYSRYLTKRFEGISTNLSEYLLEYEPFEYNTDFGNRFGKLNEVGLQSPFKGNTFFIPINNQGSDSKIKDFERNLSKRFKDVSKVNRISNSDTPYTEYENTGLGLVSFVGNLGQLTQIKFFEEPADGASTFSTQGTITGVPAIENFKFSSLPLGILEWYRIVDQSVKANPKFLLPSDLVRNLDLTIPVYIEQMGGFYVIEEISEYENPQKKVIVKVIKMVDGAEFSDDFSNAFDI